MDDNTADGESLISYLAIDMVEYLNVNEQYNSCHGLECSLAVSLSQFFEMLLLSQSIL